MRAFVMSYKYFNINKIAYEIISIIEKCLNKFSFDSHDYGIKLFYLSNDTIGDNNKRDFICGLLLSMDKRFIKLKSQTILFLRRIFRR